MQKFHSVEFMKAEVGAVPQMLYLLQNFCAAPPNKAAVNAWYARDSIPGVWLAEIIVCLEKQNGEKPDLQKYYH